MRVFGFVRRKVGERNRIESVQSINTTASFKFVLLFGSGKLVLCANFEHHARYLVYCGYCDSLYSMTGHLQTTIVFPPSPTAICPVRIIFSFRLLSQRSCSSALFCFRTASRSLQAFCFSSRSFLRFSRSSSSAWNLAHFLLLCPSSWQCQHFRHSSSGCLSFH